MTDTIQFSERNQIVYVAGPYSAQTMGEIKMNIKRAEIYAAILWAKGYTVICPHKNTAFMDGIVSYEKFMDGCLTILSRCNILFLMPGYEQSEGAKREYRFAQKKGIRIVKKLEDL